MWKKVNGATYYEVNELGYVRSLDKTVRQFNGHVWFDKLYKGTILKTKDIRGYANVSIVYDDGSRKTRQVHRLILETFSPHENQNKLQVNHKNGIKDDNRLENLEWVTCKQNVRHAHSMGLIKTKRDQNGEKNNLSKATDQIAMEVIALSKKGLMDQEIADIYGLGKSTVYYIRKGLTWKHLKRD